MDNSPEFMGKLKFINLADIFQILGGNGSTGILHLTSQHVPHKGLIYFLKGNPVNSQCGSLKGLKAIYALFGWIEGDFVFHEQKIDVAQDIKQSRMEIVLDALRMLDDGEIEKVGPPSFDEDAIGKNIEAGIQKGMPVIKGPLIDYMYVVKEDIFQGGARILKEKDHGKWMWTVFEGVVRVYRETSKGPLIVARLGEGCFIGTFKALLFGEYQRSATITAEDEVRLCLLDTEHIYREYTSLSQNFREILLSFDNRLRQITDRAVELYAKEGNNKWSLKNMKIFLKKGSNSEGLFTIREGKAFIITETQKGDLPLVELNKNDVFGTLPFIDIGHEPRSASIVGSDDLKVEKIDIQQLQKEYNNLSSTFRNMIYYVGTCITMTTKFVSLLHKRD